jgi:hypothetical protein
MALEVTCIKKGDRYNPHQAITHIGGVRLGLPWMITQDEAIERIESRKEEYYVLQDFQKVEIIVVSNNNKKYLKTENDGETSNNLLSLPECP